MKKKLLHILYSGLGGHASVVFSYLGKEFLSEYDHELLFFGVENLKPEFVEICNQRGIRYQFVLKQGFLFPVKLVISIVSSRADIVLCHSLPVVPVLHFLKSFGRQKYCLVEHASIELKRKQDFRWVQLAKKSASKLVYLSDIAKNEAIAHFGIKEEKTAVIQNGINTELYKAQESGKKNSELLIVSHGRLVKVKNLSLLLDAISVLSKKGYQLGLKIAGEGNEQTSLESQAKRLGIEEKLDFMGLMSDGEIVSLLSESDIYVNSSLIENMSTALMQAMSASLACVVSNIPGNLHMVEDEQNGLIFNSEDLNSLVMQLEKLINDQSLIVKLGENARLYAKNHFSIEQVQRNYSNLASSLLD